MENRFWRGFVIAVPLSLLVWGIIIATGLMWITQYD